MSNDKKEKIIILGQSGSGKDYLRRELIKLGLKYSPKFTTRPKRELEVQGEDYDFIDYNLYVDLHNQKKIKTTQSFVINDVNWYYGISKENWENNQLFIMTPHELNQISDEELKGCFVVYLNIDIETRRGRIMERNDQNDSIERRLLADIKDFKDYNYYDLSITDPDFEAEWIYDLMN
jgi:guanylate kinase